MKNKTILVVCGPTASGKTSFALSVAKSVIAYQSQICHSRPDRESIQINSTVNILSVDSRQVYKDLSIVTGKDIPKNLPKSIHLFGLDILNIDEQSNLADFVKYAQKVIDESINSNTPLIIVGGTGLYLKAITKSLSDVTIPQDSLLRTEIENLPLSELQNRLQKINPEKYKSLNNSDVNNPRRLIRAIEISLHLSRHNHAPALSGEGVGKGLTNLATIIPGLDPQKSSVAGDSPSENLTPPTFLHIGFMPTKEDIAKSIQIRVLGRIEDGAITEVKKILEKNPNTNLPIYSSLGISQIIQYIHGEITFEEMVNFWIKTEIDYARRQNVWFKKQSGIIWYDKGSNREELADQHANKLSNKNEKEKTR